MRNRTWWGLGRENLLILAGIVWIIAGVNVTLLGVGSATTLGAVPALTIVGLVVGAVAIFLAFHSMFGRILVKNASRIRALVGERHNPLLFLDVKGWIVMVTMMTFGVLLRASGLVPDWFIAFFYTGLGAALALSGAGFLLHRFQGKGWRFHADSRTSS